MKIDSFQSGLTSEILVTLNFLPSGCHPETVEGNRLCPLKPWA